MLDSRSLVANSRLFTELKVGSTVRNEVKVLPIRIQVKSKWVNENDRYAPRAHCTIIR